MREGFRSKPVVFKKVQFVPERPSCPSCGEAGKLHSLYTREPWDVGLEYPILLEVKVGEYKCPKGCGYYTVTPPFVEKGARYSCLAKEKSIGSVTYDELPLTKASERMARDFHISPSKSTLHRWIKHGAQKIDIGISYEPWVVESFSGVLCVDEVNEKQHCVIFATDPISDKIVGYMVTETASDEEVQRLLEHIKGMGIRVKMLIRDGSSLYEEDKIKKNLA